TVEWAYVKKNKDKLFALYPFKHILVHGKKVIGSFDDYGKAFDEGVRLFGKEGKFLIHQMFDKEPINFVVEAMF
ncbi:MAG: hypothetical protein ABIH48_01875, partial [Candidatus Falkowbacteria bacterium]